MVPALWLGLLLLKGTTMADMKIEKGCRARGLRRGDVAREVEVTEVPGTGFRVAFTVAGKRHVLWAANRARLQPGRYSVNTGNPLNRVVLVAL